MKIWLKRLLPLLLLLLASLACSPASAESCTISSPGLAFGTYDPISTTATAVTGSIGLTCTPDCVVFVCRQLTATVSLSVGSSGSFASRSMRQGSDRLQYNLYTVAGAGAPVFGDGSGGTSTVTYCIAGFLAPCNNASYAGNPNQPFIIPVFGRLPQAQDVAAGSYTDVLTATVTF